MSWRSNRSDRPMPCSWAARRMRSTRRCGQIETTSTPHRINPIPKHVVSTTLKDPQWNATTVVQGDLLAAAARSRYAGGILMHGFGPLAKALANAGALDELHLWYHPVLAGVGEADDVLLTQGLNTTFHTTGTTAFDNGVVVIAMQSLP